MAAPRTISASTQNRIMIWRSEVASAVDDAASSAASYTGKTSSVSDAHSSAEYSSSQARSGTAMMARGRRFWHRLARRLSRGRFGGIDDDFLYEPATRTAMYRAPPPPPDPDLHPGDESSSDAHLNRPRRGLKEKQERLERAALLLDH
ncbi:hypothetical protein E4U53_003645 [Claviceps sorghi]|nr:hypothetical protein E4U53_003645 [Claviceps sorghi]